MLIRSVRFPGWGWVLATTIALCCSQIRLQQATHHWVFFKVWLRFMSHVLRLCSNFVMVFAPSPPTSPKFGLGVRSKERPLLLVFHHYCSDAQKLNFWNFFLGSAWIQPFCTLVLQHHSRPWHNYFSIRLTYTFGQRRGPLSSFSWSPLSHLGMVFSSFLLPIYNKGLQFSLLPALPASPRAIISFLLVGSCSPDLWAHCWLWSCWSLIVGPPFCLWTVTVAEPSLLQSPLDDLSIPLIWA